MVIASSDSTQTLVSLHDGLKKIASLDTLGGKHDQQPEEDFSFRETSLLLPPEDCFFNDEESFHSCHASPPVSSSIESSLQRPIYLTHSNGPYSVDECFRCLPDVMDVCDELLSVPHVQYSRHSSERILYAAQGEVVHAVPFQCDVICSDRATTCHILAIRSVSDFTLPLGSISHIDAPHYYDGCIRDIIKRHKDHHLRCRSEWSDNNSMVQLDIHIAGGYNDDKGFSRKISNWLVRLLADIADDERQHVRFTLQTCAISSMNDDGYARPVGRGLALDLRSGQCFLAKCDADVVGPSFLLRSARAFGAGRQRRLMCVHHERSNEFTVGAFCFSAVRDSDVLLELPDETLMKCISTSPECEEEDFVRVIRKTLTFLASVDCRQVFGEEVDQRLIYRRAGRKNTWKATCKRGKKVL